MTDTKPRGWFKPETAPIDGRLIRVIQSGKVYEVRFGHFGWMTEDGSAFGDFEGWKP